MVSCLLCPAEELLNLSGDSERADDVIFKLERQQCAP